MALTADTAHRKDLNAKPANMEHRHYATIAGIIREMRGNARKSPVESVRLDCSVERRGEYAVTFYFADGAECFTYWGDWRVLLNWLCARRSWRIERLLVAGTGPAIPPQHPALGRLRELGAEVRLLSGPLPL